MQLLIVLSLILLVRGPASTLPILTPSDTLGITDFSTCPLRVCSSGTYTGYNCYNGVCDYMCDTYRCYGFGNLVFSGVGIAEYWGYGGLNNNGCNGGNCGYWDECENSYCEGYYTFHQCVTTQCISGPFHGYGCAKGYCSVVCYQDVCHSTDFYNASPEEKKAEEPADYYTYQVNFEGKVEDRSKWKDFDIDIETDYDPKEGVAEGGESVGKTGAEGQPKMGKIMKKFTNVKVSDDEYIILLWTSKPFEDIMS